MCTFDVFNNLRAQQGLLLGGPSLEGEEHHVVRSGRLLPPSKPAVGLGKVVFDLITVAASASTSDTLDIRAERCGAARSALTIFELS